MISTGRHTTPSRQVFTDTRFTIRLWRRRHCQVPRRIVCSPVTNWTRPARARLTIFSICSRKPCRRKNWAKPNRGSSVASIGSRHGLKCQKSWSLLSSRQKHVQMRNLFRKHPEPPPPSTPPPPSHEKSNTKKSRKTHKTITLKLTVCSLYINTHFGFTSIKNTYSILSRPDYYVLFS